MSYLALLRHGQSIWNIENRFTGTIDVGLTAAGCLEIHKAALKIKNYKFNIIFTSYLIRAIHTTKLLFNVLRQTNIKCFYTNAFNERNYGVLQGLNKNNYGQYSKDQIYLWRRSYQARPPLGESLFDTYLRSFMFYQLVVIPYLRNGYNVIIIAHGNSLRALMKGIESINDMNIMNIEIFTCIPIIYYFNEKMCLLKKKVL